MRILAGAIVLMLTLISPHRQATTESKCKIQDLAIDAALGNPEAQHDLGVELHRGDNITRDYGKAATMWRLSSNAGVVESYNNLGYLTYYGRGVKQDYAEGLRLWKVAAVKGLAESQVHIGYAYSDGKFLRKDYIEAYAWARAGKHFAAQMEDSELGKAVEELADKLLNECRSKLTGEEMKEAEKRASDYQNKFATKAR